MNFLNLCNVPRYNTLGPPVQRLMSHVIRNAIYTLIPAETKDCKTEVGEQATQEEMVTAETVRYYDKESKPLQLLMPNQAVRIQTKKVMTIQIEHITSSLHQSQPE